MDRLIADSTPPPILRTPLDYLYRCDPTHWNADTNRGVLLNHTVAVAMASKVAMVAVTVALLNRAMAALRMGVGTSREVRGGCETV